MNSDRYNPYIFGPPVQDPDYFFGRELELTVIINTIVHMAPSLRQSMAIVGPRRIGKSSLLYQIINRLQLNSNIIALVSTEQFVPRSQLLLSQGILLALREAAQSKGDLIPHVSFDLLDRPEPPEHLVFTLFRQDLKRLNNILTLTRQPPVVLMIDEVEGLMDFGGLPVLGLFRDLVQSLSHIMFVVVGSDRLYDLINDNTSPFFNVFKTITIKPLPKEDAAAMIHEPAEKACLQFDELAISKVVQISGGIPYLVNMICHYATENVLTKDLPAVTRHEIEMACSTIPQQVPGYFLDIWGHVQGIEKVMLYVLAVADGPRFLNDIAIDAAAIDIGQPMAQVRELLRGLVERQILRQDNDHSYSFINQLMPVWLQENRTAAQVVEEAQAPTVPLTSDDVKAKRERLEQELRRYQGNLEFFEEQLNISELSERLMDQVNLIRQRITTIQQSISELDNMSAKESKYVPSKLIGAPELRRLLATHFNESELRDICFDLSIDYESLPGSSKSDKVRELVLYSQRHGSMDELIEAIRQSRPNAVV